MTKNIKIITLMFVIISLVGFTIFNYNWNIAENYSIKFKGKMAEGTFNGLKGTIIFDTSNLAHSKFDITVDASTIKTGNNLKDKHARSDKWFNVEKYPSIHFISKEFSKSNDTFLVTGDLLMHGISKSYSIPFLITNFQDSALFIGNFAVNRKDFDIGNGMLSESVGNSFEIELKVPVKK